MQAQITNAEEVKGFATEFNSKITTKTSFDEARLSFVTAFAELLLKEGHVLKGSYDLEAEQLVFCSDISPKNSLRITIRFETGIAPVAYWIPKGGRKNKHFNDLQVKAPKEWFMRTYQEFQHID